jgi:hypothetical protein
MKKKKKKKKKMMIMIIIILTYCNNHLNGKYWAIVCPKFPGPPGDLESLRSTVVAVFA